MALNYFLLYIGSLLTLSIVLGAIVKNFSEGFAESGKQPFFYGSFSSIIASIGAYASTRFTDKLLTVFWILAAIFFVFGLIHLLISEKRYFQAHKRNTTKILIGEILFALSLVLFTVVVFSSLQYFLKLSHREFLFYPLIMSTLAFFIPMLFLHTFNYAVSIPPAEYKTWFYPLDQPIELPDEDPNEKLLVIGFEIEKKNVDQKKTYFRAKAPENMKLGDLYYHFINDYNETHSETPIEFTDDYEATEWWFRRKPKWYQFQKILDPTKTVKDNHIKENTVIICERMYHQAQPQLV